MKSRDPERTPFQWDSTTSAGFSGNETTWLPVNENYVDLNLEAQKSELVSHYTVFKSMTKLKKTPVIEQGSLETELYCYRCSVSENVLGVVRRHETSVVVLIVNFEDTEVTVDVGIWLNIREQLTVYASSVGSKLLPGSEINMAAVTLSESSTLVLATADLFE